VQTFKQKFLPLSSSAAALTEVTAIPAAVLESHVVAILPCASLILTANSQ
jgi:hypothetical protein